jgi:acyl-CoA reductase-like NAD-dependent aldehyde dehydrogenase
MDDYDYGLTASIWTRDAQAARTIGAQLQTGTVLMNRCDYLDPALAGQCATIPGAVRRFRPLAIMR